MIRSTDIIQQLSHIPKVGQYSGLIDSIISASQISEDIRKGQTFGKHIKDDLSPVTGTTEIVNLV